MGQKKDQKYSSKEQIFTKKVLEWDQKKAPIEVMINAVFLVGAGIAIIASVVITIQNMNTQFILWKVLPGYAIGILLLLNYIVGDLRIKERRQYAAIIRKVLTH